MPVPRPVPQEVARHYTHGNLVSAIRDGLKALGKSTGSVTVDDLAPVDEFHIGGRSASEEFLGQLSLAAGAYASTSEVLRAAVRALDREEAALGDWLRQRIDEALADPRPNRPAAEVFGRLRRHHARQLKAGRHGA